VVEGRAATVATCVAELSDYLIGRDPSNVEDLWQVMSAAASIVAVRS
jgi:galactonate dehydratase